MDATHHRECCLLACEMVLFHVSCERESDKTVTAVPTLCASHTQTHTSMSFYKCVSSQLPGSAWDPSVSGVQYLFDYIQPWHPNAVG